MSRRSRLPFAVLALLALGLAGGCATAPTPATPSAPPLRAWVELGAGGAQARVIVEDPAGSCPDLMVDGTPLPMTVRADRSQDFKVLVCEAPVPAGAREISVGGHALPAPPQEIRKIAILGDTGCRIKGTAVQNCNDPKAWPFAAVAQSTADQQPDLVIQVGDFHYRESRCPDPERCGSVFGDNWPTWRADFFDPAAPLLAAAPWVFVRGNHEECKRAGRGWLRFLDPGPHPATCNDDPSPYAVALPGLQLLVLNTSRAGSEQAAFYQTAFQQINQLAQESPSPSWLLMHHPLWAFLQTNNRLVPVTEVLQQASANSLAPQIQMVLTGHVHLFEAVGFGPDAGRPPHLVVGNSGTALDGKITIPIQGKTLAGQTVESAATRRAFGYALAVPSSQGWDVTLYDVGGNPGIVCGIAGTALDCKD